MKEEMRQRRRIFKERRYWAVFREWEAGNFAGFLERCGGKQRDVEEEGKGREKAMRNRKNDTDQEEEVGEVGL